MKKRLISAVLALAVLGAGVGAPASDTGLKLIPDVMVSAEDTYTYGDLSYKILDDGTIEITGCNESATEVVIPETIDGKKVTSIGTHAFDDCKSLSSITIPDSVTSINAYAFGGCTSLTSITIPDSVTSINAYAFENCSSLTSIIVSDNNSNFSSVDGVLYNKKITDLIVCPGGKTSITIPDSVTSIISEAFDGCSSLTGITMPDSVTSIGWYAFYNCTNLKDVYYNGTKVQWEAISVGGYNEKLLNATIHCTDGVLNEKTDDSSAIDDSSSAPDSSSTPDSSSAADNSSAPDSSSQSDDSNDTPPDESSMSDDTSSKPDEPSSDSDSSSQSDSKPAPTPTPAKTPISKATVTVANKTYTGKAIKPAPTVKLGNKTLKKGTDYTVTYKNNTKCGKATVTVTGKGSYTGTKSGSFIIKPKAVAAKKLTSPKTKQIKLTWTKAKGGVTGYQVQTALNKKFTKSKKTVIVAKASATSKNVTKLKKGTTYFARVRAYKTVGKTKYYGAWSTVKNVKCK